MVDAEAAAFMTGLSEEERAELAALDRATLTDRLKAAGLKKMGLRMKVEVLLGELCLKAKNVVEKAVPDISDAPGATNGASAAAPSIAAVTPAAAAADSNGAATAAPNHQGDLTASSIRTLTCRADYDALLREAGSHLTVLSFVCAPHVLLHPEIIKEMRTACKQTWAAFDQLEGSGKFPFVHFARLDVDDDVETAKACGINIIPTFHLYRYGKKVAELAGHTIDGAGLRALLLEHGGPPVSVAQQAEVIILGHKERTELVGQRGAVQGFDAVKGCHLIELGEARWPGQKLPVVELDRQQMAVAAAVTLRPPEGGELPSACSAALAATICGYDLQANEYEARLGEGSLEGEGSSGEGGLLVRLPPSCVVLPTGAAGVVVGLKGAPQHNGKAALLIEVDEAADRYVVALDRQSTLRLKRANFRV